MSRQSERGNVIAAVTVIGAASTLALSALMNNSVGIEARAIEQNLAETRAYWASMGHFRYAMARTRYSAACGQWWGCVESETATDAMKAATLNSYLGEISSLRTFTYPEEDSDYFLRLTFTAAPDEDPSRKDYSGWLKIRSALNGAQGDVPVLNDLGDSIPMYEIRFCLGEDPGDECEKINKDNGGRFKKGVQVNRFSRLPG